MTDFFAHLETPLAANDERPHFTNAAEVSAFVHAGKAVFTLESEKTGKRFTFRVSHPLDKATNKPDRSIAFVSVLTGPDNNHSYSYFGNIKGAGRYEYGRKAKIARDAMSVMVFEWFYREVVTQQKLPSKLKVYHEGKCGRCGRRLTVPASIRSGIGPECATKTDGF
jgi:hypothetical protein